MEKTTTLDKPATIKTKNTAPSTASNHSPAQITSNRTQWESPSTGWHGNRWHLLLAPAFGAVLILMWEGLARSGWYADFIIPSPGSVAVRWWDLAADGSLVHHTAVTLREVLTGLIIGVCAAFSLGYWLAKSRLVAYTLTPYLVALQAVPIVAVAPLLIIWFGAGYTSKVIVCALLVFFPMLVNTVIGMRTIPAELRDLMRSLEASPLQTFWQLELPAAMPIVIGGLKVSATLSVIGAVVGEFVSPNAGLGYLISFGRGTYDTPLVIAAVLTLTALALILYGVASLLEMILLDWQHVNDHH